VLVLPFVSSIGIRPALRVALLAMLAAPTLAASPGDGAPALLVQNAWIREPPPGTDTGAAYLTLRNPGPQIVNVVGFECPLAEAAMLHETRIEAGQSRMRPRERLSVPPAQAVVLAPGGMHVMLHGLKRPLRPGERVPLVVVLADGGRVAASALVRPIGSE
jgi:copper(I)-binding protein